MKTATLGDVAEFINGAAFKPTDWGEEGRRIIRIQNLNDPSKPYNRTTREVPEKYEVYPGQLLVSWSASLGVFEWDQEDVALLNQHIFKVEPNPKKVSQPYLRHMLVHALKDMERHHRGSTMVHVNRKEFLSTKIPLPPLEEQRRIAGILDQADALRRLRHRTLTHLNTLAQSIFHEMFGERLESQKTIRLGEVTSKIGSGATPRGGDAAYKAEGIPLIRSMNVRDGAFSTKGLAFIDAEQAGKLDNVIVAANDVLLNITGASVARVCIAPEEMDGARVNQHVAIIRSTEAILPEFLEAFLLLPGTKAKLLNIAGAGATRQAITKAQIQDLEVPEIGLTEQMVFVEHRHAITNQHNHILSHATLSEDLFTSLQHRAFRGEL